MVPPITTLSLTNVLLQIAACPFVTIQTAMKLLIVGATFFCPGAAPVSYTVAGQQ